MKISSPHKSVKPATPKFDFFKTISLTNASQPCKVKEKKMFLSLYKSIKKNEEIKVSEKQRVSYSQPPQKQNPLAIEGLVPVPTWKRAERRRILSAKRAGNTRELRYLLLKGNNEGQNEQGRFVVYSNNITPVFFPKTEMIARY